ncbi:MAG: sulfatase-like hydrolase/transferase, partial [Planctomycetales bacterium]|nr:sulfatase-like hydrolase/transferase [Planctomycetales bacterium]
VIFTSDNGPWLSYGDHAGSAGRLREGKGTCWDGGVRTPCVMRWPQKIEAGTVSDAALMTIDLLPTIAGYLGAKLPELSIDGTNVAPLLEGREFSDDPREGYGFWYANNQLQAVVSADGRWKLMLPHVYRTLGGREGGRDGKPANYLPGRLTSAELYDLKSDVGETRDVAAEHPDQVERLTALAASLRERLGDSLTNTKGSERRPSARLGPRR